MKFEKVFTLSCIHPYFANGYCAGLHIEPTDACKKLLKGFRMMCRQEGAGMISIIRRQPEETSGAQEPVCISALEFYLFVSDTAFFTYTKNALQNSGAILRFSSTEPPLFAVSEIRKPSSPQNRILFGMVSIVPPAVSHSYMLSLEVEARKWRYYIVSGDRNMNNMKISSPLAEVSFIPVTDAARLEADAVYQALQQFRPEAALLLYESTTAVAFSQNPRKKIQLVNASSSTVMVDNLPNPTVRENGAKIISI